MLILFTAFIFGVIVLLLLIRSMKGGFSAQLNGKGIRKVLAIIKLILLIEIIIYLIIFMFVIIKTVFTF